MSRPPGSLLVPWILLGLLTVGSLGVLAGLSPPAGPSHVGQGIGRQIDSSPKLSPSGSSATRGSDPASSRIGLGPSYGRVAETLDLLNRTLIHGDFTDVADGIGPYTVVADSGTGTLYVADSASPAVSIVDESNSTVSGSIPLGATPTALAIDPAQGELFVVTRPIDFLGSTGNVSVISIDTHRIIGTVPTGGVPSAVALDSENGYLYVALASTNSVDVVDPATFALVANISVGTAPDAVAYDAGNGLVYVANNGSDNVTVIYGSNDSVAATVSVGAEPVAIQPLDGTDYVYVAEFGSDAIAVLNGTTNALVNSVLLGFGPQALAEDSTLGLLYTDNSTLNVFDAINFRTQAVISTVSVGRGPAGLTVDPTTGDLFIAESLSDNLTVAGAATRTILGTIQLGLEPVAAAYDRASNELGVVMADQDALWLFNSTTDVRLGSIPVGTAPAAVAYDSINECFYVANEGSATVSVVNGTTNRLIATVTVKSQPDSIAFAPSYGYLFVADGNGQGTPVVTEIDGADNQVVANLAVGGLVSGIAYDASNGDVYVGAGTGVTVLDPISKATVTTIPYSSSPVVIGVDSDSGEVVIGGLFSAGSGLASNVSIVDPSTNQILTNVTVAIGIDGIDYDSETGLAYVASEVNDTVTVVNVSELSDVGALSVGSGPAGIADDGPGGQLFVTNPDSATLSIETVPGVGRYPVNFSEVGLPAGHSWTVTVAGKPVSSSSSSIVAVEPDGNAAFNVTPVVGYSAAPNASTVTIDDAFAVVSIVFTALPPTYSVQFVETGLPTGANWSVFWQGQPNVTTDQTSITVQSLNGTFTWVASSDAGYAADPTHGSTTVAGTPLTINITFTATHSGTGPSGSASISGLSAFEGYGVAGAAAAVGAVAGGLLGRGRGRTPEPSQPSAEPPSE
jgi:YVTN family beta-propeller protein